DVPEQKLVGASLTLMSWFNWDVGASARNAMLISRDSDVGGRGYTFDLEDSSLTNVFRFYVAGGGGGPGVDILQSPNQSIVAGTDNIAFATNDTSTGTCTLYLNGAQVSSGVLTTPIPAATTNTRIGSRAYAGFEGYFAGKIRL